MQKNWTTFLLFALAACPEPRGPEIVYTQPQAVCGNGRQQTRELCDSDDLDDMTCGQLGYGAGTLACKKDCQDFDRSGCGAPSTCGNDETEGVEICDGADLGDSICETLGLGPGTLRCLPNCGDFDVSDCAPPPDCGDNTINGSAEICDGDDLNNLSCSLLGYAGGELRCATDCLSLDTGDCIADQDAGPELDSSIVVDSSQPDRRSPGDAGVHDLGSSDTHSLDQGSADSATVDSGAALDAGSADRGFSDATSTNRDGGVDAGPNQSAAEIQAIINDPDGPIDRWIHRATITYRKPEVGVEYEGVYVQALQNGPAVFVQMTAGTMQVGNQIDLHASEKITIAGQVLIIAFDNLSLVGNVRSVEFLRQDISNATDLFSNMLGYSNELISLTATIESSFGAAGPDHVSAPLASAGMGSGSGLMLRMPTTLQQSLGADLYPGCTVLINGIFDPFIGSIYDYSQATIWRAEDIQTLSCN